MDDEMVSDDRAAVRWAVFSRLTPAGRRVAERMSRGEQHAVSDELLLAIREEWQTAGFLPSNFTPRAGQNNKTVLTQSTTVGQCYATATTTVTVTHS